MGKPAILFKILYIPCNQHHFIYTMNNMSVGKTTIKPLKIVYLILNHNQNFPFTQPIVLTNWSELLKTLFWQSENSLFRADVMVIIADICWEFSEAQLKVVVLAWEFSNRQWFPPDFQMFEFMLRLGCGELNFPFNRTGFSIRAYKINNHLKGDGFPLSRKEKHSLIFSFLYTYILIENQIRLQ